jgi:TetR/AcrR family transcriptional regulator, acrAB operon repressor
MIWSINIHSQTYVKTPHQPKPMVRRTKEEAQQTRNALLDAAELVFERRGVSSTSLQEVAEAAGLTRGAVYWHFRDKADLFNAMMDRAVLPFERQWLEPADDDVTDPMGRLRELMFDILRQVAVDARLQRVFAISTQKVEYVGELDAIRERHLRVYHQALLRIEALLRQAAAAGQLAGGVSPQTTARGLHALVDGLIANWMLDPRAFDLCRVGRSAVRQMLRGLAARA